ncbi:MAG: hypothetical protein IK024_12860 [Treponema sp.]|nr:hypothetical protein [Treponema sp.]
MNNTETSEQTKVAILLGSAPEDKIQPKLKEMADFLQTEQGGNYQDNEILLLPSCPDEITLEKLLFVFGADKMLFYICTTYATQDWEQKLWLSENEITKSLFEKDEKNGIIDVQVIYDVDRNFIDYDGNNNFLNNSEDFFFAQTAKLQNLKG